MPEPSGSSFNQRLFPPYRPGLSFHLSSQRRKIVKLAGKGKRRAGSWLVWLVLQPYWFSLFAVLVSCILWRRGLCGFGSLAFGLSVGVVCLFVGRTVVVFVCLNVFICLLYRDPASSALIPGEAETADSC